MSTTRALLSILGAMALTVGLLILGLYAWGCYPRQYEERVIIERCHTTPGGHQGFACDNWMHTGWCAGQARFTFSVLWWWENVCEIHVCPNLAALPEEQCHCEIRFHDGISDYGERERICGGG